MKKAKVGGRKCHDKTMMIREASEDQGWDTSDRIRLLVRVRREKDEGRGEKRGGGGENERSEEVG